MITTFTDQREVEHVGGPLWVAREITADSWPIADLGSFKIIGRKRTKAGVLTGPSSAALLWRAIESLHGASKQNALACCGLIHPKVQDLLGLVNSAPGELSTSVVGSHTKRKLPAETGGVFPVYFLIVVYF